MKHLRSSLTRRMSEDLLEIADRFREPTITQQIQEIMKTSSLDIICATDFEEFFYKESKEVVPEGEPIGVDVDREEGVELVLFSNIYWNPPFFEDD